MNAKPRSGSRLLLTIAGLGLIVALAIGGFFFIQRGQSQAEQRLNYSLVLPQRGPLSATVNAAGSIQPRETRNLSFTSAGIIAEVLVKVGDTVRRETPLARLDSRELELRVRQSEASLAQTRTSYEKLLAGVGPAELAQAQAQLAQARAQLRQVQGGVTVQDLSAARAQVDQARANLSRLQDGPKTFDVQQAQAQLDQATANSQSQRDSLSAAKVRADSQLEQAANTLRNAQDEYSRVYWQNRNLEGQLAGFNRELPQDARDREALALRTVQNAEENLAQAQSALEQARKNEVSGVAVAETQVTSAQANLDRLFAGPERDQLAAARAQLAQAEASLSKLQGDQRGGSVAVAGAGVANAEANLERVSAPRRAEDLAAAQAQILGAEAALEQAQLALERATLVAPIDGTIAEVNLKSGELLSATRPAIILADLQSFYVDVTVDEIDVAQIELGQPVDLSLDALPDLAFSGEVIRINPLSTVGANVTSYSVRIEAAAASPKIRPGMSANADIVVAAKDNVLAVPRRAVRVERGLYFVDVTVDQALCLADRATWPPTPPTQPVEVSTGLSNDLLIEIISGDLVETSCIYVEGLDARLEPFSGPPPRPRN